MPVGRKPVDRPPIRTEDKVQTDTWAEARVLYITDSRQTLKSISEKFNLPYGTCASVSSSECWNATRLKYREMLGNKTQLAVIKRAVTTLSDLSAPYIDVSNQILEKIRTWLAVPDIERQDADGRMIRIPALNLGELASLTKAALNAQTLARIAVGAEDVNGPPRKFGENARALELEAQDITQKLLAHRQALNDVVDAEVVDAR